MIVFGLVEGFQTTYFGYYRIVESAGVIQRGDCLECRRGLSLIVGEYSRPVLGSNIIALPVKCCWVMVCEEYLK